MLLFFLTFVLPQFADLFRDFNAKLDPILVVFLSVSAFLRANAQTVGVAVACFLLAALLASSRPARAARGGSPHDAAAAVAPSDGLPSHHPVLPQSQPVAVGRSGLDDQPAHSRRHDGGDGKFRRLDDDRRPGAPRRQAVGRVGRRARAAADGDTDVAPRGGTPGQLSALAGRIAEFHEAKLQRSLDRAIGIIGPLAIIMISLIVGGLIVSVMTALLSVYQVVG